MPLSSASMWLNIRDSLVRFLLQRTTKTIVSFRKKKTLLLWTKQNQHLLQFKNDSSTQNSYLGLSFKCFPSIQNIQNMGITSKVCVWQDIFHNDKLCIISLRWAGYFQGKNPSVEKHIHRKCAKPIFRPHLLSIEDKTSSAFFGLGSENSFWEHIGLLLPQTMEAECLSRSPEAPNTIDLLREYLTDNNRPKLPRECKNTCRFFLKW